MRAALHCPRYRRARSMRNRPAGKKDYIAAQSRLLGSRCKKSIIAFSDRHKFGIRLRKARAALNQGVRALIKSSLRRCKRSPDSANEQVRDSVQAKPCDTSIKIQCPKESQSPTEVPQVELLTKPATPTVSSFSKSSQTEATKTAPCTPNTHPPEMPSSGAQTLSTGRRGRHRSFTPNGCEEQKSAPNLMSRKQRAATAGLDLNEQLERQIKMEVVHFVRFKKEEKDVIDQFLENVDKGRPKSSPCASAPPLSICINTGPSSRPNISLSQGPPFDVILRPLVPSKPQVTIPATLEKSKEGKPRAPSQHSAKRVTKLAIPPVGSAAMDMNIQEGPDQTSNLQSKQELKNSLLDCAGRPQIVHPRNPRNQLFNPSNKLVFDVSSIVEQRLKCPMPVALEGAAWRRAAVASSEQSSETPKQTRELPTRDSNHWNAPPPGERPRRCMADSPLNSPNSSAVNNIKPAAVDFQALLRNIAECKVNMALEAKGGGGECDVITTAADSPPPPQVCPQVKFNGPRIEQTAFSQQTESQRRPAHEYELRPLIYSPH